MNLLGSSAAFFDQYFENPSLFSPAAERFATTILARDVDHLHILPSIVHETWEATAQQTPHVDDIMNTLGVRGEDRRQLIRKFGPGEILETWIHQFLVPGQRQEEGPLPKYLEATPSGGEWLETVFSREELRGRMGDHQSPNEVVKFYYATTWCKCRHLLRFGPNGSLFTNRDDAIEMCFQKISPLYSGQCLLVEYTLDREAWEREVSRVDNHCYSFPETEEGQAHWNRFNEYLKGYSYDEEMNTIYNHPMICSPFGEIILRRSRETGFRNLAPKLYFFHQGTESLTADGSR